MKKTDSPRNINLDIGCRLYGTRDDQRACRQKLMRVALKKPTKRRKQMKGKQLYSECFYWL